MRLNSLFSGAKRAMVSIASVPGREASLRSVVSSLFHQIDRINIYLNGYPEIPEYLDHPKLLVARSQDYGDLGDAGKFFWLGSGTDYYLTCDDDILYPPDYVARTIRAIERYGRRAIVGWHGSILNDPFSDYYVSRTILSFYRECECDVPVQILGTGTMGFHTSTLELALSDFPVPNMADVWFAVKGQRARVPFIVCAHQAGELRPIEQLESNEAIWQACAGNSGTRRDTRKAQNELVLANWPWSTYDAAVIPPLQRLMRQLRRSGKA